jgi:phosphate transport system permease protein
VEPWRERTRLAEATPLDLRSAGFARRNGRARREAVIRSLLFACAAISVITSAAIVLTLATETYRFFQVVPILEFLTGTEWTPNFTPARFGVLPLVCGTLWIVVGSSMIAIPVGLASAIYLSEIAPPRARSVLKPILEVLAGIPTVVYGFFALTFVTPALQAVFPGTETYNAASASIVVGIMILPMVASLCDDAIRAVPRSLRQGAYALGATSFETSTRVVVPAALSGIVASFVLALSRAVGETMAVTLAAGSMARLTASPLESIQTMTAFIVQMSLGDVQHGDIEYQTIFAVAALLFLITLGANVFAHRILRRFREVYE